ncbi:MAG TPA: FAD-binding domain [Polyangiaceae bacterium]|nr:FAD-binding domain [Polyangiaceae bacterium]
MEVAINGTGIAGPTLAYWLRRWGHAPVLFEKASVPRSGGYVIDFWGLGYELAERMGIVPGLRERCYLMQRLSMVDARGREVASMDVTPMREQLHGRFVSVARADLAALLFEACRGVPTHFGVSIAGLEPDGDGVVALLSNGARRRFDLVVGADGLHSRVRELAFGPESKFEQRLGCHVAAFRLPDYRHRDELTYVSHTVPKRHVARVALPGGETLVLLVCRSELVGDPPRSEQKAALRRAFGEMKWEVPAILDGMDAVEDLYFDRVSQIHLPRWSSGRTALLGDAAACASLLAGEGTGLAMLEAYVLAGEIHRARSDVARGLAAYDARLRSFVGKKQNTALGLRGFFAPQTALGLVLRNAAVNAFSIPFVAKHLVLRSLRDDFELPDYEAA